MNLELTSVRAKLARSQEHFQTLRNEVAAWVERDPCGATKQVNYDSTRYSIHFRVHEPPPLQRWTIIVSDCIANLRCALDHLVYSVAVADTAKNPPPHYRRLQFPICDKPEQFDKAVSEHRLGEISAPVRAVFHSLQPFNRPRPDIPPLLSILRDLNDRDKHRAISLSYMGVAQGRVGFQGLVPVEGRNWTKHINRGEVVDGTELFALSCDAPTPNMQFDITEFAIVITVEHGKRDPSDPNGSDRSGFYELLKDISDEVRFAINSFCRV